MCGACMVAYIYAVTVYAAAHIHLGQAETTHTRDISSS